MITSYLTYVNTFDGYSGSWRYNDVWCKSRDEVGTTISQERFKDSFHHSWTKKVMKLAQMAETEEEIYFQLVRDYLK